jgi:hypothetical protein
MLWTMRSLRAEHVEHRLVQEHPQQHDQDQEVDQLRKQRPFNS